VKVKRLLIAVLNEILDPMRERRRHFEQHIEEVYAMLKAGSERARAEAAHTLEDVRRAMRINYFEDEELIARQAEMFKNK
jgi:tryptophanyl-tRNA synthetase